MLPQPSGSYRPKLGRSPPSGAPIAHAPLPSLRQIRREAPLLRSNMSGPTLDNAESRLGGREQYVVSHYRLGETLQGKRANLFGRYASFERRVDALTEQNLPVPGLSAKTGGDIAYGADRGVAEAF